MVYRWAYAYSVPGAKEDFIAQNAPPEEGGQEPDMSHKHHLEQKAVPAGKGATA